MPAIPAGPFDRQQAQQVASLLNQWLARQVALEVWTRAPQAIFTGERDDGRHGQAALDLMRQLKSLHPSLTLTPYDLDRQAAQAAERGIEHSPTITMRCGGRGLRTVGLFFGPFFQAFLDALDIFGLGGGFDLLRRRDVDDPDAKKEVARTFLVRRVTEMRVHDRVYTANFTNNSKVVEPAAAGINKLSVRWLFWMQFLLDQPEFLNLFSFFL